MLLGSMQVANDGGTFPWNEMVQSQGFMFSLWSVSIVAVIVGAFVWYRTQTIRLKTEMVCRGFSAEEIERVMNADPPRAGLSSSNAGVRE